jgi:two-component system, LytTR family, sensor kinase
MPPEANARIRKPLPDHPRFWVIMLACWALIALAHVGRSILYLYTQPGVWLPADAGLAYAVVDGVYDAAMWFIACLAAYVLAPRLRLDGRRWLASAARLAATALLIVLGRAALVELLAVLTPLPSMGPLESYLPYVPSQLMFACIALGAGYSVHWFFGLAEQEALRARLEAEFAEARLEGLRAQLHPHFLFNALNSVSALLHLDPAGAREVLLRLRTLLRMVLGTSGAAMVPLEEELELARAYLALEQVRFGDRLRVRMEVDPAVRGLLVPPLVLQPSVENAVRHGAAPAGRPVCVGVHAGLDPSGARLELTVEDDGVGLPPGWNPAQGGIGIRNTRERLRAIFGRTDAVQVAARPGGGTRARIVVPVRSPVPAGAA